MEKIDQKIPGNLQINWELRSKKVYSILQRSQLVTVLLVWSFIGSPRLLRPLLTSRSGQTRHRFRHEARSPQVRMRSFAAQSSHLRHLALTTRASQSLACSPCSVPPHMRFVFLDSRFTLHASFPRSVTLTQLRFTCLAVASSAGDFHPEDRAHAGRTNKKPARSGFVWMHTYTLSFMQSCHYSRYSLCITSLSNQMHKSPVERIPFHGGFV